MSRSTGKRGNGTRTIVGLPPWAISNVKPKVQLTEKSQLKLLESEVKLRFGADAVPEEILDVVPEYPGEVKKLYFAASLERLIDWKSLNEELAYVQETAFIWSQGIKFALGIDVNKDFSVGNILKNPQTILLEASIGELFRHAVQRQMNQAMAKAMEKANRWPFEKSTFRQALGYWEQNGLTKRFTQAVAGPLKGACFAIGTAKQDKVKIGPGVRAELNAYRLIPCPTKIVG